MSRHPLYARWRILEKAVESVVLAAATGDVDLEEQARELALSAAERLEVPKSLLDRMENDRAISLSASHDRAAAVLSFTAGPGRVSS